MSSIIPANVVFILQTSIVCLHIGQLLLNFLYSSIHALQNECMHGETVIGLFNVSRHTEHSKCPTMTAGTFTIIFASSSSFTFGVGWTATIMASSSAGTGV